MANWKMHDVYNPQGEWKGKDFYTVVGNKWAKHDAVAPYENAVPTNWLTFSSAEPFTLGVYNNAKHWDGTLYYSTDTATWSEWDGVTVISSAEHDGEQKLYMRGSGNSVITGAEECRWILDGSNIRCNGDIENLLDHETVANGEHPTMASHCYDSMFSGCTALKTSPELTATTLAVGCYYGMFKGCTALTVAPELPATSLAVVCYANMFDGCASITTTPKLPATTLANTCYYGMFKGCTSLTTLPELSATSLTVGCYNSMFSGCTSIKVSTTQTGEYQTAYRLPTSGTGTIASNTAIYSMFDNTGGTFTGTPEVNTTYYTSNTVV